MHKRVAAAFGIHLSNVLAVGILHIHRKEVDIAAGILGTESDLGFYRNLLCRLFAKGAGDVSIFAARNACIHLVVAHLHKAVGCRGSRPFIIHNQIVARSTVDGHHIRR